ncbi:MAG: CoA transferase [Solirubrobacteraceae bacterium]|jgi:crotonobetainyl-CoA:carnitine CoA-transferase CaiB-like acyl-CoA transferase|nr:CoA transferase [Solirubrobacteraceae bacterium]MDP4672373.1 CoA transferase [Solirubrobacteraceae bacterium]MDP4921069.1 CoA transferase [Solirubrobacteraceae bacterium]MDP5034364.1 CoA transferase [Solirubrobacteraceae bacterium]
MTARALSGIIVADFSRVLAGPLASQTLADLGADVIKIERPEGGDDTRQWGPPFVEEGSTYYLGLNRGKRSLTLDLKDPADQQLALELCRRADVIFESFRPGTMDRLGLGWEAVRQDNPRAIYTSISAFGSSEDGAALPGYDLLVQAMSGYMSITGSPDGPATKPGTALIDLATGLYAATGTLAALQERERSGEGQHVEVALLDSALAMLLNVGSGFLNTGELPVRNGNAHPSIAPYQTFPTATEDLALAVGNDAIFTRLCDEIGEAEMATDSRFATNSERVVHSDALIAILSEIFAGESAELWTERLTAAGVPAGPVNDVAQAYEFADALGLEPIIELDGVRSTRSPMRLSRTPAVPQSRPPRLGEHNDELRSWLSED